MSGFSSLAEVEAALAAGRILTRDFYSGGTGSVPAPAWASLWVPNVTPGAGGTPASGSGTPGAGGTAYTNAVGGMVFPDTPDDKVILNFWSRCPDDTSPGHIRLMDRLVGVGSIALNSTGDKNINSVALPRYTSGEGVEAWIEYTQQSTTTNPVVSLASYTNQDGTSGRVGGTLTLSAGSTTVAVNSMFGPLPLQAGDTGIRSVEVLNVATASTNGTANLVLARTMVNGMHAGSPIGVTYHHIWPLPNTHPIRVFDGATLAIARLDQSSAIVCVAQVQVVYV
jgi:hypothetical protein